jgi:hypothetical protein
MLWLDKRFEKTDSGIWRTEAPKKIPPASTAIFASESLGGGTDARVTYAMSVATGAFTAEAIVTLRWVNKYGSGQYVDITTEFSCSPGLVVEFEGPTKIDNSMVTFIITTEAGAQPGRYHPEKGDVRQGRVLGRAPSEPRSPLVMIPPSMLELPRRREPPSGLAAQLSDRAGKASRSMVVYIDNRTPFSFTQTRQSTPYGSWTREGRPPTRIEPNQLAVVVSESSLVAGTEASVEYSADWDTGGKLNASKARCRCWLVWVS